MKRPRVKRPAPAYTVAVHVLTASGAALALLAMVFASAGAFTGMFFVLGIALIVDGVDGPLARYFNTRERLPRWSGETLDLVVDFLTYVFVPAYAIVTAGLMPPWWALAAGALIVVTGALYFAGGEMKTNDNYFLGFPAVWNLVAFYLLLLRPQPLVTGTLIIVLATLTFAPMPFVHPLRVTRFRIVTTALMIVWAGLALLALLSDLAPDLWVIASLCIIALYFLGAGLLRSRPNR